MKSKAEIHKVLEIITRRYYEPQQSRKERTLDLVYIISLCKEVLDSVSSGSPEAGYTHYFLALIYEELGSFEQSDQHFKASADSYQSDLSSLEKVLGAHAQMFAAKAAHLQELATAAEAKARKKKGWGESLQKIPARLNVFAGGTRDATADAFQLHRDAHEAERRSRELLSAAAEAALSDRNQPQTTGTVSASDIIDASGTVAKPAPENEAAAALESKAAAAPEQKETPPACLSPKQIRRALDKVVIGQNSAKRGLANGVSLHLRRALMSAEDRAKTDKTNILIAGPTGCGKTLMVDAVAKLLDVPCYKGEASQLTAVGYVGNSVITLISGLLREANFDVAKAERGIVYLDEVDKIAAKAMGGQKDVGGRAVQEELLKMLEGAKFPFRMRDGSWIEVDTTNILFIVSGAFDGLEEIVDQRLASSKTRIGFGATVRDKEIDLGHCLPQALAPDFIKFGLIPEFIGRLPKRLFVRKLTELELEKILIEPEKALCKQMQFLCAPATNLFFTRGAVTEMAKAAHAAGTNGRALREIMEKVLEPVFYDQEPTAVITAQDVIDRNADPEGADETPAITAPAFILEDADAQSVLASPEAGNQ